MKTKLVKYTELAGYPASIRIYQGDTAAEHNLLCQHKVDFGLQGTGPEMEDISGPIPFNATMFVVTHGSF